MNKSSVQSHLSHNSHLVGRAMVLLLSRQTPEERSARTTCESNGRGFNINDAEFGTYLAH